MTNNQYFRLEELKHKYNQKLEEAQEAHDEQEATYFSGVVNGIQIAARELLEEPEDWKGSVAHGRLRLFWQGCRGLRPL